MINTMTCPRPLIQTLNTNLQTKAVVPLCASLIYLLICTHVNRVCVYLHACCRSGPSRLGSRDCPQDSLHHQSATFIYKKLENERGELPWSWMLQPYHPSAVTNPSFLSRLQSHCSKLLCKIQDMIMFGRWLFFFAVFISKLNANLLWYPECSLKLWIDHFGEWTNSSRGTECSRCSQL